MLSKMLANESAGASPSRKPAKSAKVCGVCGDRAKSYHFGGVSCDSCKAFFRRSVQNDAHRAFQCAFHLHATATGVTTVAGRCDINMTNRKCCQFCRFRKCLDIGMEPSWVMTEEERVHMLRARMVKRKRSDHHNRGHHVHHARRRDCAVFGGGAENRAKMISTFGDETAPSDDFHLQSPTSCHHSFPSPAPTPPRHPPPESATIDISQQSFSSLSIRTPSPVDGATEDDDSSATLLEDETSAKLSQTESGEIEALVSGLRRRFRSGTDSGSRSRDQGARRPTWDRVLHFMVSIQKLVKFARGIQSFVELTPQLQVALLRANIFEMFLVIHFARETDPCLDFSLDALLESKGDFSSRFRTNRKRKFEDEVEEVLPRSSNTTNSSVCPYLAGAGGGSSDSWSSSSSNNDGAASPSVTSKEQGCDTEGDRECQPDLDPIIRPSQSVAAAFRAAVRDTRTMVLLLMVILFCPDSVPDPDRRAEERQLHFCSLLGRYLQGGQLPRDSHGAGATEGAGAGGLLPKLLLLLPGLREIKETHQSHHFDLNNCEDMDIAELLLLNGRTRTGSGDGGAASDSNCRSESSASPLCEEFCIDK